MKHFNPDFPAKSIQKVTIYANKITLTGTSGTANITINGILNTTIATFATDLTTTAANWITANYAFYYARGFVVSNAAQVITVLPRNGWETVNRINATIANATTDLAGTYAGTCVIDPGKAKTWRLTLNNSITMNRPVESVDGEAISIEFINGGSFTVTWAAKGFYFAGGTEPTVTSGANARDVFDAVFQASNTAKVHTMTLTGSNGTGNIAMVGLVKLATYNASPTQTAADFVTDHAAAFLAAGVTVTSSGADLIFTTADSTKYAAPPTFTNVTLTLAGATVTAPGGRWLVTNAAQDIKQ